MRMRYFEPRRSRIELIPMIDVMFFLLVFFLIVTLHMIPASGIGLVLPQSGTAEGLPRPEVLVTVTAAGTITVRGQTMTTETLTRFLAARAPRHPEVTIAADRGVPFQRFMKVMDACRRAGISGIGIAAQSAR